MAQLTANKSRQYHGDQTHKITLPMPANLRLFAGAAVMPDGTNGWIQNCTPTASGKFYGFTTEEKDNRTGSPFGGTDASTTIEVLTKGVLMLRSQARSSSSWTAADIGATFYASDGDTFTDSAGTNNIAIGKVLAIMSPGSGTSDILVAFEASGHRSI
jgi:hypothetical protein